MSTDTLDAAGLAECPFCGSAPQVESRPGDGKWTVYCHEVCAVSVVTHPQETEAEAIAAWNRRATPSAATPAGGGRMHGPYGWLNGHRALSEDSWTLEGDPLENSDEYFAIPLYALVDPFKEIGRAATPPVAPPAPAENDPDTAISREVLAEFRKAFPSASKPDGSNYVANQEINPTLITFANGRTVSLNHQGYLDVGWAEVAPPAPTGDEIAGLRRDLALAQGRAKAAEAAIAKSHELEAEGYKALHYSDELRRAEIAERELASLREETVKVLEPFAAAHDEAMSYDPPDAPTKLRRCWAANATEWIHFIAARALLTKLKGATK